MLLRAVIFQVIPGNSTIAILRRNAICLYFASQWCYADENGKHQLKGQMSGFWIVNHLETKPNFRKLHILKLFNS